MSYTAERTKAMLVILHSADRIVRRVEREPLLAALFDLERDIYAETIVATGIDPAAVIA